MPLLTLGVPVFDGEKYLPAALDSLLAQDVDDVEILISDNASTDATQELCRDAARHDARVRYVRQDRNRGGVWNVNYLVHAARGDLFKWAYYDDVVHPGYVRACLDVFARHGSDVVGVHTRVDVIDASGAFVEERADRDLGLDDADPARRVGNLLSRLANQAEFAVMRTATMRATRGMQPFIGSEMAFLVEMLGRGRFVQLPETLLSLRRHPDQYGANRFSESGWYAHAHQRGRYLPFAYMNVALASAAWRSPLPAVDRLRCVATIPRAWTFPRWRSVAGDVRHLPQTIRAVAQVRAGAGA